MSNDDHIFIYGDGMDLGATVDCPTTTSTNGGPGQASPGDSSSLHVPAPSPLPHVIMVDTQGRYRGTQTNSDSSSAHPNTLGTSGHPSANSGFPKTATTSGSQQGHASTSGAPTSASALGFQYGGHHHGQPPLPAGLPGPGMQPWFPGFAFPSPWPHAYPWTHGSQPVSTQISWQLLLHEYVYGVLTKGTRITGKAKY